MKRSGGYFLCIIFRGKIERCNFDGNYRKVLVSLPNSIVGLAVFEHFIYWSEAYPRKFIDITSGNHYFCLIFFSE